MPICRPSLKGVKGPSLKGEICVEKDKYFPPTHFFRLR